MERILITHWAHKRCLVGRNTKGIQKFNNFIQVLGLMEVPLSNGKSTWSRGSNDISHFLIDRFFISKEWDELFENMKTLESQDKLVSFRIISLCC